MKDQYVDLKRFVTDLINRFLCCSSRKRLGCFGDCSELLDEVYPEVRIERLSELNDAYDLLLVNADGNMDWNRLSGFIENGKDIILFVDHKVDISHDFIVHVKRTQIKQSVCNGDVFCFGKSFEIPDNYVPNDDFRVLAIVHFYNEEDIIIYTVEHLINQGLNVYLLDNWSTDNSYELALELRKKYPNKIYLEKFPQSSSNDYLWYDQLKKTEEISLTHDYDWYIHYDMDEIRETPWNGVSLRDAIGYIDSIGYNCIENTVVDFRMTTYDDDIYPNGEYFDFRYEFHWIDQLKTWKKCSYIDLKSTGGHHAQIETPKIYPLKFLNRHYPLRNLEQAKRKVFVDRIPRFKKERSVRGWHTQYDNITEFDGVIYKKSELCHWDTETLRRLRITLFSECGLNKGKEQFVWNVPQIEGQRIAIYGAGRAGRYTYLELAKKNNIVAWVDRNYLLIPPVYCSSVLSPDSLAIIDFDYVVVAVINEKKQSEINEYLVTKGIEKERVFFVKNAWDSGS